MSDIDITIGAKNNASKVIRDFSNDVNESVKSIEFSFKGMAQMAGAGVLAAGFLKLTDAAADFASSSLAAFDKTNKAAKQLEETLEIITGNAGASGGLKQLANELEKITNIDAGTILTQMSTAGRKGGTPEDIEEMTKAAIGLARVYNTDLSTAMRKVQDAVDGSFGDFKDLADVSRVAEEGLKKQAEAADSAAEAGMRMEVSWKNLQETVGRVLNPLREIAIEIMDGLVTAIDTLIPNVQDLVDVFDWMRDRARDAFRAMADVIVTAVAACSTVIQDFSKIIEVAGTSIELTLERIRASFQYVFSEAIPSYLKFFSEIYSSNGTAALDMIFGPLAKGDFSKIAANISGVAPAFKESDQAKSLQTRLDSLTKGLTEGFMDRFGENKDVFDNLFEALFNRDKDPFDPKVNLRARGGAGEGQERILGSFQSDVLRFAPNAPGPDKLVELAMQQLKEQQEIKEQLREQNQNRKQLISLVPTP